MRTVPKLELGNEGRLPRLLPISGNLRNLRITLLSQSPTKKARPLGLAFSKKCYRLLAVSGGHFGHGTGRFFAAAGAEVEK